MTGTDDWARLAAKELKGQDLASLNELTPEGIAVKPLYTADDVPAHSAKERPGIDPFTRGVRATMYAGRPWTIRQYAGFSTAEETNAFFKANLAAGQKGLSVAFDLATHRGYDSDHPYVTGDVGTAGVAIDTASDMQRLFDGIALDKISVSMTMNGAVIPVLAMFTVAGERQGVARADLSGTIQNDILKEFMVRNTYIYPPDPSMRIVADIIELTALSMPKFNSISISGYHMHEAGATLAQELGYTLADGMEYVRAAMRKGLDLDQFAGRLSFFFATGMDFFMEIAKLRAARQLWARIMTDFGAREERSKMLRTHCQTSGVSLTEQDPHNNIVRTAFEAMAAILGGTQSLHTNAFDEALALPSEFSARIARNTQHILHYETGVSKVVDPLGGSYYIEALTKQLAEASWSIIQEIEALGGMTKAVEQGLPKANIEAAAVRRQARVDRGEDVIIGVNKFCNEEEPPVAIRQIDNEKVRIMQIAQLHKIRARRDNAACSAALDRLRDIAATGQGNLLEGAIEAARADATLGEISLAMEEVFGRFQATSGITRGVYGPEYGDDPEYQTVIAKIAEIKSRYARSPRIFIAKLGQDGHDRGARVVAAAFSDLGFDVRLGDLFGTPEEIAVRAKALEVDIVGVSSLAAGHKTLVPQLIAELKKIGGENIPVICGGVIPAQDYQYLRDHGVAEIFGPGSNILQSANAVLAVITGLRRNR